MAHSGHIIISFSAYPFFGYWGEIPDFVKKSFYDNPTICAKVHLKNLGSLKLGKEDVILDKTKILLMI